MDVMSLRRGLLSMSKKSMMASGEFNITEYTITLEITHNLGSRKIFFVAQRTNENKADINETVTRYKGLALIGWTKELLDLDEEQTYSYKTSDSVSFDYENGHYPSNIYSYFPAETNPSIASTATTQSNKHVTTISDNMIRFENTGYALAEGRWLWRAYALD